jgi:hypothetical protein
MNITTNFVNPKSTSSSRKMVSKNTDLTFEERGDAKIRCLSPQFSFELSRSSSPGRRCTGALHQGRRHCPRVRAELPNPGSTPSGLLHGFLASPSTPSSSPPLQAYYLSAAATARERRMCLARCEAQETGGEEKQAKQSSQV